MRVLVTGGSGFIGTNLVESLLPYHEVVTYDTAKPMNLLHEPHWRKGSILDRDALTALYQEFEPELVFHLAARTDLSGLTLEDYSANTVGVGNVIDAGKSLAVKPHTIYASSRLVFDIGYKPTSAYDYKPTTVYGESKVHSEQIIRARASEAGTWLIVRPTSIWGPWFGVPYRDFFDRVERGHYVHIKGVSPKKSYGYVGNCVYQLHKLAFASTELTNGNVFWLSDYPAIDLAAWANVVADEFGVRRPITLPIGPLRMASLAGDALKRLGWKNPPLTSFRLNNLRANMEYDTTATQRIAGPLPFSLTDGVRATVAWMKSGSSERWNRSGLLGNNVEQE